jgi:two-component system, LytTR family, sensor kinase
MKSQYPLKKLSVLNIWFILTCTLFLFAFILVFLGAKDIQKAILGASLALILLMLTCFANILWMYLLKKKFTIYPLESSQVYYLFTYISSAVIFLTVVFVYDILFHQDTDLLEAFNLVIVSAFVNTLIVIFHKYIALQDAKMNADIENAQLKAANTEAANLLLRQQIHPHFFFNALNILKSLYKLDPLAAEEYLVCLSDFLRSSISSNNIKVIPLKEELKLCENYLGMQKIRFGEALFCSVSISKEALENSYVPSFSIQPLIENAIKHNELTKASPLHIFITQDKDRIKVYNNLKYKTITETSTGIGLANLSERYRIISNDELVIENKMNSFSVSIKILNKEDINRK